jgi:hypothetical protein
VSFEQGFHATAQDRVGGAGLIEIGGALLRRGFLQGGGEDRFKIVRRLAHGGSSAEYSFLLAAHSTL